MLPLVVSASPWTELDPIEDVRDEAREYAHMTPVERGRLVAAAASPIDDVRGTADYRRHALSVLAARCLGWAWSERPLEQAA